MRFHLPPWLRSLAVVLVGLEAAACGKVGGDDARGATDSAAAARAATGARRPAPIPMSDSTALALLDAANVADSAAGAVALERGTHGDVRAFGRQMMRDHRSLRQLGRETAGRIAASAARAEPRRGGPDPLAWVDSLRAIPRGAAFDLAYLDRSAAHHEAVLQTAQQAMDATDSEALRDLLRGSAPRLQAHLDRARVIRARLGASAAP